VIHSRVIVLDASGTAAVGSATCPPARYSGVAYQFSNASASVHIDLTNLGQTLFAKNGASNSDGLQQFDPTKREPLASGTLVANVNTIINGQPGDTLAFTVLVDLGGSG